MEFPQPSGSFRAQLTLLTAAITVFGVVVLTAVVQVVLARSATSSLDTVLIDRAEAVISSTSADGGGRLTVPDDRLDAGVAVYDGEGRLIAGSVPSSEAETYASLASTTRRRTVDQKGADESRVLAEPFSVDGTPGVVVVTERLAPYERAERLALYICIGAGLLMVALAAGLAQWVSRRALAPVSSMSRAADDWSEHDLSRRFEPGPGRNEIAALGRTLDRLLDRVAHVIRSEQRLTSELAHELRTPLAAVQANADLALLDPSVPSTTREALVEIAAASRRMSATIESLLELARRDSGQGFRESCSLRDAVAEATAALGFDPAVVEVRVDPDLRVLLPRDLAVRALSPVLDNARRHGTQVVVSTERTSEAFVDVLVDDDGPGIAGDARERVFEPGHTTGSGAGLGLALARRVARSTGGDVAVGDGPLATRFVISLPVARYGPGDVQVVVR